MLERKPMMNLKLMRIKRNLSQVELAKKAHIAQNALSAYECGKISPKVEVLCKLAEALECDIKDII